MYPGENLMDNAAIPSPQTLMATLQMERLINRQNLDTPKPVATKATSYGSAGNQQMSTVLPRYPGEVDPGYYRDDAGVIRPVNDIQPGQNIAGGASAGASAGLAAAGALGLGPGATAIAGAGGAILGASAGGFKWPWQTPEGEGFIAPWTQQLPLPGGGTGQQGVAYGAQGFDPRLGIPVKAWTNASKDGSLPASVEFVQFARGHVASRSLITGFIKVWKPKKHIVISNNPRISAIKKLDRVKRKVDKMLLKVTPRPRKSTAQVSSKYLSAVERKALG